MDAEVLRERCLGHPDAIEDLPFGPYTSEFKVAGNTVTLGAGLDDQLMFDIIEDSYDLVVSALPRRIREEFGWTADTDAP